MRGSPAQGGVTGRVQHALDAAPFVRELAHTADAGFEVTAPTLPGCFERAVLALAMLVADTRGVSPRERRPIAVAAEDVPSLLHDLLHATLLLAQVDRFLVSAVEVQAIEADRLVAVVAGETYDPARHHLHGEVKAVTWHELGVARADGGWRARVILDV